MIAACLAISAGAAAMALATFSASLIFLAFVGMEWECCAWRTGTTRSTRMTRRWTLTRFIGTSLDALDAARRRTVSADWQGPEFAETIPQPSPRRTFLTIISAILVVKIRRRRDRH